MKKISLSQVTPVPTSHNSQILKKVIAKNGDIPGIVQIAQATLNPGDEVEEHVHKDLYEVFYIEHGEVQVTINSELHYLKAGDIITIEPNDLHAFKNLSAAPMTMFYFGIEKNT